MILSLKNMSVTYESSTIISGLNLQASKGEFIGLVGTNGAGKSCLLKTIAGLLKPQYGKALFESKDIHKLPLQVRAQKIAYLAQDRQVKWSLPVWDMVALGRVPYRGSLQKLSENDKCVIDQAMKFTHCEGLKSRRFDRLSGGEQMRVHLARALAVDAPLMLADEPIAALDPYYQISILEALAKQAVAGKTIIASLHDLTLARQFCSRIWVVHDGKIIADDIPNKALSSANLAKVFTITRSGENWEIL